MIIMILEKSGQKGHSVLLGIITFGIIVRDSQSILSTFIHHTDNIHWWVEMRNNLINCAKRLLNTYVLYTMSIYWNHECSNLIVHNFRHPL